MTTAMAHRLDPDTGDTSPYLTVRRAREDEIVDAMTAWAPRASYWLALEDGRPAATLRLISAEPGEDLPLDDVFHVDRDRSRRAAELSRPEHRLESTEDSALVVGLLRAAYDDALTSGVEELYVVADQPVLSLLRGLGFRFRAVAGPTWANSSWNIVAVMSVDEVLPGLRLHQAVHGCRIADFFGDDFDGAVSPDAACQRAG